MHELNLLSYLVQRPDRYGLCRGYLEEFQVESPILRQAWQILKDKYETYKAFPSSDELKWALGQQKPEQSQEYASLVDYLYTTPATGVTGEYLTKLLIDTEKTRLFDRLGTSRSLSDLKELQERIRELESCLSMDAPRWFSPFDAHKIKSPYATLMDAWGEPIPFGLPGMDDWLQGGGRRGELVTLIGLTGGGKSIVLMWWALWQAMQGYKVVYFSFDNVVGEILSRLWCAASGIGMNQTKITPEEEYARRLQGVVDQFPGIQQRFFIEKSPRGTRTVKDIENSVDQIEQSLGIEVDAIYVDYGDCVKPENIKKDTRFQLDETFSSLGALAEAYSCLVITATQANRAAKQLEILDIDSAAEAWQKAWHSAIVMALCQTRLQKLQNKAGIVVPKARRTRTDFIVSVLMDPDNMRIIEDPERPIVFRAALEQMDAQSKRESSSRKNQKHVPQTETAPQEADSLLGGLSLMLDGPTSTIVGAGLSGVGHMPTFPSPLQQIPAMGATAYGVVPQYGV